MSVLLAKVYNPLKHNPVGWWMSEKFDGVRALWTGKEFVSRTGKPFHAPDWFIKNLPDYELDGELWVGRGGFQKTVSVVRKKVPVDSEWKKVTYKVFDAPNEIGPFEMRMRWLNNQADMYGFQVVVQHECNSREDLHAYYTAIIHNGGEGVMLREHGSLYVRKRSGTLLKMKPKINGLAVIIGVQAGTGKHEGRMGALELQEVVDTLGSESCQFKVGTGFSDAQREEEWKIGTVIKWEAGERTDAGIPRFPRFIEGLNVTK